LRGARSLPVIRVSRKDLERLVGRRLSTEEILDLLPRLKCEVEMVEDDALEYEATHDRPDLFSVEGLARGLRYLLGIDGNSYECLDLGYKAYAEDIPERPYIAFAIVKDLELDSEAIRQIMQLQEKLATTYGRGRRKASIGVYDLDKVEMPVYYELKDPSTRFKPLNETREMSLLEILEYTDKGREYGWIIRDWKKYPVLRDSKNRILSMPPIINSEDTKVTEATSNILIDVTGTDLDTVVDLVTIMAFNIAERSRTRKVYLVEVIYKNKTSVKAPLCRRGFIEVDVHKVNDVIGIALSSEEAAKLLTRMGFSKIDIRDSILLVEIPAYRVDIRNCVDIAEEIAIAIGYENLGKEAVSLPPAVHPGRLNPIEHLSRLLRKLLASYGYIEVANYMMSNPHIQLEVFGISGEMILVSNPKMDKYTGLRVWLTPGLLEVVAANIEREKEVRVFEIGDVVIPSRECETGACSERRLGVAISHDKATLTDGLALATSILESLGLKPIYRKASISGMLPQRCAEIVVEDTVIGFVGEVHPLALVRLGIEKPVVVLEIKLNTLLSLMHRV